MKNFRPREEVLSEVGFDQVHEMMRMTGEAHRILLDSIRGRFTKLKSTEEEALTYEIGTFTGAVCGSMVEMFSEVVGNVTRELGRIGYPMGEHVDDILKRVDRQLRAAVWPEEKKKL